MAYDQRNLDDYVDVAERIQEFYDRYPEGSLQPADPSLNPYQLVQAQGFDKNGDVVQQTFVVYVAAAYRHPDDVRPGIGVAWEVFPGRTPYTRGSEVMNAETSAWGRAIAALGIATKKGIASRQEVANRRGEREDGLPTNADGSLSRSRTTDAEKDAAGVMTAAQQAEHTALQPKQSELRGKVSRMRAAVADEPWYDPAMAASELEERTVSPEQRPGSIGPAQLRHIHEAFKSLGITERVARLTITAGIIGRDVESSKDLSYAEAQKLLAELATRTGEAK